MKINRRQPKLRIYSGHKSSLLERTYVVEGLLIATFFKFNEMLKQKNPHLNQVFMPSHFEDEKILIEIELKAFYLYRHTNFCKVR